jgi:hypothetical protein
MQIVERLGAGGKAKQGKARRGKIGARSTAQRQVAVTKSVVRHFRFVRGFRALNPYCTQLRGPRFLGRRVIFIGPAGT